MNAKILLLFFTVLTLFDSCNFKKSETQGFVQENYSGDKVSKEELVPPPPSSGNIKFAPPANSEDDVVSGSGSSETVTPDDKSIVKNKKIIKDGDISVKTSDIKESKKVIDQLLKEYNAYYEIEDLQNNDQMISYDLKIRVPAENFEKLISRIEDGKDEIKGKSIQARDVTEEFVDIETRLKNKRDFLKQYKELLSRASTVKDILAIEENIRILQEEIESKEGRLKYLSDQVAFSTLDINLYKDKEFIYKSQPQARFSERVKTSLGNGWASVVNFVLWTISIWPYFILTFVGFFVFRKIVKKRKIRQA
jgi:hypothetical protein